MSGVPIDVQLKALACQNLDGVVWLSYTDPSDLPKRFGLNDHLMKPITAASVSIEQAAPEVRHAL